MAKVIAINISEQKKTPKKTIEEGTLIENLRMTLMQVSGTDR